MVPVKTAILDRDQCFYQLLGDLVLGQQQPILAVVGIVTADQHRWQTK